MKQSDDRQDTPTKLIEAGLHLFGHAGFDATSTREIAARAGTNVASIAYHFGSKSGLRAACARSVGGRISAVFDDDAGVPVGSDSDIVDRIERIVRSFVHLIVATEEARNMVAFVLRELTDPGDVADQIYTEFIEPRHKALCAGFAAMTGRSPEDEQIKLAIFALIGQVLYFRIGQPFVARRLGWDRVGEAEARRIADTVVANLRGTIERLRI